MSQIQQMRLHAQLVVLSGCSSGRGQIMSEGRDRLLTAWWLTFFPGAIIFFLALSVSLIGDWLRDHADVRLRSR